MFIYRRLAWLSMLLALLLASGCTPAAPTAGAPETTPSPSAAATAAPAPEATAKNATTRLITDARDRQVTVPLEPQRVVTLSEHDLDSALALGITPVGTVNGRGQSGPPAYLGERTRGITSVGSLAEPSLETIATLDPDLILAGNLVQQLESLLPQLEQIAPVVVTYRTGSDWKTAFRGTANALNRRDAAERFLQQYDQRVAELRALLPADRTVTASIVRWMPQGPVVMNPGTFASSILADVGMERPAHQHNLGGSHGAHSDPISLESLEVIDGDWIFLGTLNAEGATALQAARSNPLFQRLQAVQNNHVVDVDGTVWTSTGGPLAALQVLDDVERAVRSASQPSATALRTLSDTSRLVTIGGTVTEIAFALGAGEQVVAVDTSSTYPPAAAQRPKVGYQRQLAAEGVLALNPSAILISSEAGPPEAIEQLRSAGVPLISVPIEYSVAGAQQAIRSVAQALGRIEQGETLIAQMERELAEARQVMAGFSDRPRVLFLYARGPNTVNAAGRNTPAQAMIELAGGQNAITEFDGFKPLTPEAAAAAAPDVILMFESGLESLGGIEGLLQVPGIAQTPAGQQRRIVAMDGLYLLGFGPRLGAAVRDLAQALHQPR
ncbi:ABC transporter substrate-binding protein [Kallotenue papyrolyticum]|uniref:ABC transporter substrate-binding protein n=1 Tax=Kallotenue papyrolyticum TaxID=1325125 RepID=UPI0004786619|nr:ABC transporter substrate-binding protein [Kallotenue papyrolyticum]